MRPIMAKAEAQLIAATALNSRLMIVFWAGRRTMAWKIATAAMASAAVILATANVF